MRHKKVAIQCEFKQSNPKQGVAMSKFIPAEEITEKQAVPMDLPFLKTIQLLNAMEPSMNAIVRSE